MKFIFCYLIVFAIIEISIAQDYSIVFGKITQEEIELKSYPADTSAPAVFLYNIGQSYALKEKTESLLLFERSAKIKIFTKAGYDYAQVEIPFYFNKDHTEEVTDIVAFTYNKNPDGTIHKTPLREENIFVEKKSDNWKLMKFTMPDIHEGSVIEFKYLIKSPFINNVHDWNFQTKIPVSYSQYVLKMSPFKSFTFILQGVEEPKKCYKTYDDPESYINLYGNTFSDIIQEFTLKNIPAFTDEKYITSPADYIIKVQFQLSKEFRFDGNTKDFITTWPKLCDELLRHEKFGRYIKACERNADDLLEQLNIKGLSPKEQLKTIVDYVKTNYSWNGTNHYLAAQTIKEFFDTKSGSSANINLFLLAILNKAGIEALPVILSTRDHGKIKADYPFLDFFNYVAVLVNIEGTVILTDATEPLLPYFLFPPKCINERGLAVKKDTEQLIELSSSIPSIIDNNFSLVFNQNIDSILGTVTIVATQYDALELRKTINDKDENKVKFVEDKYYTLLSNVITSNFLKTEKPYSISFKAAVPIENVKDKIYINPFLNETFKENPFKSKERKYPIDMIYCQKRSFNVNIKIPENYHVTFLPSDAAINNDLYSMNYKAVVNQDALNIKADYYFKKAAYQPEEYENLKLFFTELVDQMNKKIVLEKIIN